MLLSRRNSVAALLFSGSLYGPTTMSHRYMYVLLLRTAHFRGSNSPKIPRGPRGISSRFPDPRGMKKCNPRFPRNENRRGIGIPNPICISFASIYVQRYIRQSHLLFLQEIPYGILGIHKESDRNSPRF